MVGSGSGLSKESRAPSSVLVGACTYRCAGTVGRKWLQADVCSTAQGVWDDWEG